MLCLDIRVHFQHKDQVTHGTSTALLKLEEGDVG